MPIFGVIFLIYLDNAATSGTKPRSVIEATVYALKNLSANPGRSGHNLSLKTSDSVYSVRKKVADFFGANGPENVIFTQSCTHSINYVLKGALSKGDHIVISNLEHNAVMRPLKQAKISYTVANVDESIDQTVYNFKNAIKPNTRMIFVTSASNVTGKILPIEEIGMVCKNRGILFAVDAAQSAGVLPIDMQKFNIDFLCAAPHKGLYAPMGIGLLICRKPLKQTILEGGTGTESKNFTQPLIMPEGFESGTINVPAIMGLSAGMDFVKKIGITNIYNHEFSLYNMLFERLNKNTNIQLYTKNPSYGDYVAVIPFNTKNMNCYNLSEFLNKNGIAVRSGFHCAPTAHAAIKTLDSGACRVSMSIFNNKNEIDKLCNILEKNK